MKADFYIHIGLHKTGSTSIQATMFRNRKMLLAHGINYLALNENHSTTIGPLFMQDPHLYLPNKLKKINTEAMAAKQNKRNKAALLREISANRSKTFVISGEDLSRLRPECLQKLKDFLTPFAARFRIVAYVRDPYATINSVFQHRVRGGHTFAQIMASPPRPFYRDIAHAIDIFGRENVDIRIFNSARFVNGDLIADFLSAIGGPPELASELNIVRANEAISHEAAHLLNEINKRYPEGDDRSPNPARSSDIVERLSAIPGQAFRCPSEVFVIRRRSIGIQLRWLRETLGEEVFPDGPWTEDIGPRWTDETLGALAVALNDLAKAAEKRSLLSKLVSVTTEIYRRYGPSKN
jgi:hypothetical protein